VFAFPQDVVSQASKASPEMSNYREQGAESPGPLTLTTEQWDGWSLSYKPSRYVIILTILS